MGTLPLHFKYPTASFTLKPPARSSKEHFSQNVVFRALFLRITDAAFFIKYASIACTYSEQDDQNGLNAVIDKEKEGRISLIMKGSIYRVIYLRFLLFLHPQSIAK